MKRKILKTKGLFIIYVCAIVFFSAGWHIEEKALEVEGGSFVSVGNVPMDEFPSVEETSEETRGVYQNMDEFARREIKQKEKIKTKKAVMAFATGESSRRILERIVEAEAGGQDVKGRLLVANVILNRVKSKQFPNTIKGVVFSPGQFSPVSNGRYYSVTVSKKTKLAVEKALAGEDVSKGALYFMCRSASDPDNVTWFDRALTKLFSYGGHEFFR